MPFRSGLIDRRVVRLLMLSDLVTHVNVVPPIALALLQSPLAAHADFSSVKCIMNAAAPLKQALADALSKRMGCVLTQWYGMTEASPSCISQREGEAHIPNTIGRLLPGMQMRIVDENGRGRCSIHV